MNRLEKLKEKLCDKHLDRFDLAPTTAGLSFCQGWNAASAEYEKIIAELEGALKVYSRSVAFHGAVELEGCILRDGGKTAREALQKLKDFKNTEE